MRGAKRFFTALVIWVNVLTTLLPSVAFAQEETNSPTVHEEMEGFVEVIGEEEEVVEFESEAELDPSMYVDTVIANEAETENTTVLDELIQEEDGTDVDVPLEETPELIEEDLQLTKNTVPVTAETEETAETQADENVEESETTREPINEEVVEVVEETDETLDEEVELQGLFDCKGNHYETKSKNVSYYNKATKGRTKKGTIAKAGTVVKVVDTKYSGAWLISDKYYKLDTGYWVLADNIKSHECTGGSTKTTHKHSQRSGDNKYHNLVTSVTAKKCKTCKCVMDKAKETTKKEKHSGWYGTGYCGVCGYKFKIDEKSMKKQNYMLKENLTLRKEPYSDAAKKGSALEKGTVISLDKKAENAHGNLWYKSTDGGWVYSSNVTPHDHSYSSSTGKCSCGKMFGYEKNALTNTAYVSKSGKVTAYQHPYTGSTVKEYYEDDTVFYVNAYSYSDPNGWWLAKGDKWFRTTDGYWVLSSKVKQHTDKEHKYSQASMGKCTYNGCTGEYELDIKWIHSLSHAADIYETKSTNKSARVKPYSKSKEKAAYPYKYQIVMVDRYVKENANGEKWYRTTSGYWIKSSDIQLHSHHLIAGECTSVDCGHVINIGLKTYSSKVYETTSDKVCVMEKPFDDAKVNRTLPKANSIKINGNTTKLDDTWYRTTDNKYVKACYLKVHKHSYTNGYCSVCGQYAKYTTQSINPKIVETTKDGVTVFDKPYDKCKIKRTVAKKGEKIVITEQATNYYENIWYRVSTGGWVYSKNVKAPSGGEIKTSNKAKIQDYIITVTDNKNNPIPNAYIEWLDQTYKANEKGNVELVYVTDKTEFKVSAPDYDSVTKKDYKMNKNRRDTIVLALTGSFEATNVNMTYVGETTDLLKVERSVNHYHTLSLFDTEKIKIECEMGSTVGVGKYRLVQGSKVVAESTDGTFKNLSVRSFTPNKSVQLQIFDKSGTKRATQKLLLNVFNITEEGITNGFSLGATDLSLKFSDGTPFLGSFELKFDLTQTLNFALEVGDESTKAILNFTHTKGDDDKFEFISTVDAYKKFFSDLKSCKADKWSYFWDKHNAPDNDRGKWKGTDLRIGGYVEKMHGENVWKGKIFFEIGIEWKNYWQTGVGPVPVVIEVEVEGKATPYGSVTLTNFKEFSDGEIGYELEGSIEGSVGVGIKYVASISAYGKATLKIEGTFLPFGLLNDAYLYGNFGLKAKLLDMEIANLKVFETPTLYIVKDGEFVLWEAASLSDVITNENNYVLIDRRYLDNRSGWYNSTDAELMEETETDQEVSVVVSSFDFDVLQSSTYTDIRPQVVTADGIIMMVYNDDNATRENVDKSMLVYSIYNPDAKEWSAPVPVNDDTTADYNFAVCSSNNEIYIVWQNAKTLHNSDATLTDISKNTELYVAKYDAAMGSFRNVEQVTNNEKYEAMPRIASVNGKTVVSWYTNENYDVFATDGNNTVEYAFKYDEDYAPKQDYVVDVSGMTDEYLEEEILPSDDGEAGEEEEIYPVDWIFGTVETRNEAITSLAVGYMLDESYIAYTTDADRNTATANDQNIWLYNTQTETLEAYTDMATNVEFTTVHGDRAMTWYNQGMIYYALDSESAPQKLYTEETLLGEEYHIISDDNGNMAILFTSKKEESSDAYVMLYDDETFEWGLPITVTNQDKYIENFNGAYSDGMIVSIFNQTEITDEEMNETNNLCSAVIGERHDVSIANASFNDFELEAGVKMPLLVDVKNNGTVRISGFIINVYNGEEIVAQQSVDKVLKTGETTQLELEITLPEILEKTTYTIEIEEVGYDDAYVADNSLDITIGRSALVVTAESSPTDTENIVVLTVENIGYEASGGMVALFDDNNNVKEILVENFEPVEHGESYSCAISLSEEYFDGAAGKTFNIGVVPTEEQDIDAYNIATVYVDNINHDNLPDIDVSTLNLVETAASEDISLMEETVKSITGKVKNETEQDIENAKICALEYDDRGVFLGMKYLDTVSLVSGEEAEFTAEFESMENISIIKIVLVNNDDLEPLSAAVEIRLHDDLTDEDEGIDESEDYDAIAAEEE